MKKKILTVLLSVIIGICISACSEKIDINEQLALGDRYLQELNFEQALICYEKVISVEPKNMPAYIGLANAYLGQGNREQAVARLEAAMEIAETSYKENQVILENAFDVYLLDSSLFVDSNNVLLALDVLERGYLVYEANDIKGPLKELYWGLMLEYMENDDYSNAIAILKRGMSILKDNELQEKISLVEKEMQFWAEYEDTMKALYQLLFDQNYQKGYELWRDNLKDNDFVKKSDGNIIYSNSNELFLQLSGGYIYFGNMKDGVRTGTGKWIHTNEFYFDEIYYDECYCMYDGEWLRDLPNGAGVYIKNVIIPDEYVTIRTFTISGYYLDGLEHGQFDEIFVYEDGSIEKVSWTSEKGTQMKIGESIDGWYPIGQVIWIDPDGTVADGFGIANVREGSICGISGAWLDSLKKENN